MRHTQEKPRVGPLSSSIRYSQNSSGVLTVNKKQPWIKYAIKNAPTIIADAATVIFLMLLAVVWAVGVWAFSISS